jgi:hypothetical protein
MSKKSNKLTDGDKKDLEAVGWSETSPFNVPDNVSPVLKAKIFEAYSEQQGIEDPSTDLHDATYRQNEFARQRAAADGDEDMQKVTGVQADNKVDTKRQTESNK